MTGALVVYSATFMRYSLAVQPKNYLLFACHFINEGSQLTQGYRYLTYHGYLGGKDQVKQKAESGVAEAKAKAGEAVEKAGELVQKTKDKLSK